MSKIIGFNPHAVIKPYETPINENLFKKKIVNLSRTLVYSNSGEGVLINKDYTKGLLLRGYLPDDFKKLSIVQNINFLVIKKLNPKHISIGKRVKF